MITLKPITILSDAMPECIALDLPEEKTEDEQVFSNALTLACAHGYASEEKIWDCYAIYDNDTMMGLISYNYFIDDEVYKETCYRIRPFALDVAYAGKGFEIEALKLIFEIIKTKPYGEADGCFITYDPDVEADMIPIYTDAGFVTTDLTWDAEDPDCKHVIARLCI